MALSLRLTPDELRFAAYGAVDRRVAALAKNRQPQYGDRISWDGEILAVMAEAAVAKWRDRYWTPVYEAGFHDLADVGRGEVRASAHADAHLILRPTDREKGKQDAPFVLVVTEPPEFHIVGWLYGREVMIDEFWRGDSWWAPQDRLRIINPTTKEQPDER